MRALLLILLLSGTALLMAKDASQMSLEKGVALGRQMAGHFRSRVIDSAAVQNYLSRST